MKAPFNYMGGGGELKITKYLFYFLSAEVYFFTIKQYIYFSLCVEIYIYFTSLYKWGLDLF